MRLGIGSYSYGWAADKSKTGLSRAMSPLNLLYKAVIYGINVVQIADNMPLHMLNRVQRAQLAQAAKERGISLEVGTRGLTPENMRSYIAIARELDSVLLRVVIDAQGYEPSAAGVVSVIREILPVLKDNNVTLAIENHDRFPVRELRAIIEECASRYVGVCLDSANSLGAGEGIEMAINSLAEYTVNLHVKDFEVKRLPSLMGFTVQGRPAGQGMLDIPRLIQTVSAFHPDISAILELWTPPEKNIRGTLHKEERWVKESLAYLRCLIV